MEWKPNLSHVEFIAAIVCLQLHSQPNLKSSRN